LIWFRDKEREREREGERETASDGERKGERERKTGEREIPAGSGGRRRF